MNIDKVKYMTQIISLFLYKWVGGIYLLGNKLTFTGRKMGKHNISNFYKNQFVIARQLGQNFPKTAAGLGYSHFSLISAYGFAYGFVTSQGAHACQNSVWWVYLHIIIPKSYIEIPFRYKAAR